ncbi:MAG: hypothetical protein K2X55_22850 [Burkholderiaceae bacterium]|nr:hypothetical protein [Burkholderiaceae bacterium]
MDRLQEFGMLCSMSRKGNCWDNAPTESWFNGFKNERAHGVKYKTLEEMKGKRAINPRLAARPRFPVSAP